jgi:hypothetical protein
MTVLQPLLLWGLAAAAVPILIHLLNRLRFRSLPWGAMMFLVRATRTSTRRSRLRHWLILACRALALACFAYALARPLIGGWLGTTLGGRSDAVVLLFDRSASMESLDPRRRLPKREEGLRLLSAAGQLGGATRYILIDSATLAPQPVASPEALAGLNLTRATDTAADWPALFRTAGDWLLKNQPGRADIWAVSDLQTSNWQPDGGAWPGLAARLAGISPRVRVRVLALPAAPVQNRALNLRSARTHRSGAQGSVQVAFNCLQNQGGVAAKVPVAMNLNGQRTVADFESRGARDSWARSLAAEPGLGWGFWELPADDNLRDNRSYFVYGGETPLQGIVVAEHPLAGRMLQLAVAPANAGLRKADLLMPATPLALAGQPCGLIVWQGALPAGATAVQLRRFASEGGAVLFLPPSVSAPGAVATNVLNELAWGELQPMEKNQPFRVTFWEEQEGPLEKTADGRSLPVAQLAVTRRAAVSLPAPTAREPGWVTLAAFVDGKPFLARRTVGRGAFFACPTLPAPDWSDLDDGRVLVPMIQRMLEQGASRFSPAEVATCGEWKPAAPEDIWSAVEPAGRADPLTQAGVYRCGQRWLALNRPAAEDVFEPLTAAQVRDLLPGVDVTVTEDHVSTETGSATPSEVWPLFVLLGVLFLLAEAWLTLLDIAGEPRKQEAAR